MEKRGILLLVLMINCLYGIGQQEVPLFLRNTDFDVSYEYNPINKKLVIGSCKFYREDFNFNENTFYLKRDSVTTNSRMQYEYFKIRGDLWLEVKTINKKSTIKHFIVKEEIVERDTLLWFGNDDYSAGGHVIYYNKLDTLPNKSIEKINY